MPTTTTTRSKPIPMRVLALGMSRTGTASMKAALQILGHSQIHHGYELYIHPSQSTSFQRVWQDPTSFTPQDWDVLLAEYSAVTDMPAVCFAPQLLEAYPNAQVVLTTRGAEEWYASFEKGVIDTYWDAVPITGLLSWIEPELIAPIHNMWTVLFKGYFECGDRQSMKSNSRRVYQEHNELVRRLCAERGRAVLEFDVRQGWEPLCEFLGESVPDCPFPRVNEGDVVKEVVAGFMKKGMVKAARNLAVAVVVLGVLVQCGRTLWARQS